MVAAAAMAASSALPPARSAARPDAEARTCGVATIPRGARASGQRVRVMERFYNYKQKPSPTTWRLDLCQAHHRSWGRLIDSAHTHAVSFLVGCPTPTDSELTGPCAFEGRDDDAAPDHRRRDGGGQQPDPESHGGRSVPDHHRLPFGPVRPQKVAGRSQLSDLARQAPRVYPEPGVRRRRREDRSAHTDQ